MATTQLGKLRLANNKRIKSSHHRKMFCHDSFKTLVGCQCKKWSKKKENLWPDSLAWCSWTWMYILHPFHGRKKYIFLIMLTYKGQWGLTSPTFTELINTGFTSLLAYQEINVWRDVGVCKHTINPIIGKLPTANREKDCASEKVRKSKRSRERKRAALCVVDFGHSRHEGTLFYFQIHHPLWDAPAGSLW